MSTIFNRVKVWFADMFAELEIRKSQKKAERLERMGCCNEPQDDGRCCSEFDGKNDAFVETWMWIIGGGLAVVFFLSLFLGGCDAPDAGAGMPAMAFLETEKNRKEREAEVNSLAIASEITVQNKFYVGGICEVDTETKRVKILSPDVKIEYWAGDLPKMPTMETVMDAPSDTLQPMDASDYAAMEAKAYGR